MRFNATTTRIQDTGANVVGSASAFSMVVWLRPLGAGEGGQGRVFVLDEAGNAINLLLTSTSNLRFSRVFSGGTANHDVSAFTLGRWFCYALAFDASDGANIPTIWTARDGSEGGLTARAVTTADTTGTPTTPNAGFTIGNRGSGDRTWDGDIAYLQVFDRVISRIEAEACMLRPGSVRKGRVLYAPLINDPWAMDKNGRRLASTTTVTGAVKGGGPRGIVEFGRRRRTLGMAISAGAPVANAGRAALLGVGM